MFSRDLKRVDALLAARAILAVMLLLSLLSGCFAFALASSAPLCRLACCAGRPPHAADSCLGGSCHAVIAGAKTKTRRALQQQSDRLCGLSGVASRRTGLLRMRNSSV